MFGCIQRLARVLSHGGIHCEFEVIEGCFEWTLHTLLSGMAPVLLKLSRTHGVLGKLQCLVLQKMSLHVMQYTSLSQHALECVRLTQHCSRPAESALCAQLRDEGPRYEPHCRRIKSALLPAAEMLLRGVLDLRHEHWRDDPPSMTARFAVEQARCTAI